MTDWWWHVRGNPFFLRSVSHILTSRFGAFRAIMPCHGLNQFSIDIKYCSWRQLFVADSHKLFDLYSFSNHFFRKLALRCFYLSFCPCTVRESTLDQCQHQDHNWLLAGRHMSTTISVDVGQFGEGCKVATDFTGNLEPMRPITSEHHLLRKERPFLPWNCPRQRT